jgi:hypothetical protein
MRIRIALLAAFALVIANHAGIARAGGCSEPDIARAAGQIDLARKALIALPVGDDRQTEVSPQAQQAISRMKDSLAAFVGAYMRCAPPDRDAATIQQDLDRLAHAYRLENKGEGHIYRSDELPKDFDRYGFEFDFTVKRWNGHPDIVGIVPGFEIECGWDAMLLVYTSSDDAWQESMLWQSKPYQSVAEAFGSFDYAISPADDSGNWYVLTKTVAPWCSSAWSTISYAALRPGPVASEPKILYQGKDSIWWGNKDFGKLVADKTEFDVRFHAESIDTGVHNRVWIRHFKIAGDTVRRIQPVALTPRDFADEWIASLWQDASQWTSPEARGRLSPWHLRLHKIRFFDYDSVRYCADRPDHYQVALLNEDEQPAYYLSVTGQTEYLMTGVSAKPDPACNGENVLDTMDTQ